MRLIVVNLTYLRDQSKTVLRIVLFTSAYIYGKGRW